MSDQNKKSPVSVDDYNRGFAARCDELTKEAGFGKWLLNALKGTRLKKLTKMAPKLEGVLPSSPARFAQDPLRKSLAKQLYKGLGETGLAYGAPAAAAGGLAYGLSGGDEEEAKTASAPERTRGFIEKCAEYGIDPNELLEKSAFYNQLIQGGSNLAQKGIQNAGDMTSTLVNNTPAGYIANRIGEFATGKERNWNPFMKQQMRPAGGAQQPPQGMMPQHSMGSPTQMGQMGYNPFQGGGMRGYQQGFDPRFQTGMGFGNGQGYGQPMGYQFGKYASAYREGMEKAAVYYDGPATNEPTNPFAAYSKALGTLGTGTADVASGHWGGMKAGLGSAAQSAWNMNPFGYVANRAAEGINGGGMNWNPLSTKENFTQAYDRGSDEALGMGPENRGYNPERWDALSGQQQMTLATAGKAPDSMKLDAWRAKERKDNAANAGGGNSNLVTNMNPMNMMV